MPTQTAIFAGGCFWCTEAAFEQLRGVTDVTSGYAGGSRETANYKAVCGGDTGHAEVARITFDPAVISYRDLLDVFFTVHDPTTLNRQGNDMGTQYRSVIFYTSEEQRRQAEAAVHMSRSQGATAAADRTRGARHLHQQSLTDLESAAQASLRQAAIRAIDPAAAGAG